MTDHIHTPDCEIQVVVLDTNSYFMQYHFLCFEDGELVFRGRAGTMKGAFRKLTRKLTEAGYAR